jgi:hypothetical protein
MENKTPVSSWCRDCYSFRPEQKRSEKKPYRTRCCEIEQSLLFLQKAIYQLIIHLLGQTTLHPKLVDPLAMAYSLPTLPYAVDALEPHVDATTMTIHHTKHHQVISGTPDMDTDLELPTLI